MPTRAIAGASDPRQVVGRIADHIKDNYARLHTVGVLLQTTHLDRSVTKREEVTTHGTRRRDGPFRPATILRLARASPAAWGRPAQEIDG